MNKAIYNVRQYYFTENEYLCYEKNYALLKSDKYYQMLNSNMSQQIIKEVDSMFKAFFARHKQAVKGKYSYHSYSLPSYIKDDEFTTLIIGYIRIAEDIFAIPYSRNYKLTHPLINIKIPRNLVDKKIKQIRIIPKNKAMFFEVQYVYENEKISNNFLDESKALSIDLGVNNFISAVTNTGQTFIIDGRYLKSINQWYNK